MLQVSEVSSSSTSTSSDSEYFKCRVCSQPTNGMYHYGAIVCRACAAFFRRALTSPYIKKCHLNQKCKLLNEKRYFTCKFCRLKKCYDVGMTADNFQWNRDAHTSSYKIETISDIPKTLDTFSGNSSLIVFNATKSSKSVKFKIDFQFLIDEALNILKMGPESPLTSKSRLEKLSLGLHPILRYTQNQKTIQKYGKSEALSEIQHDILAVTKWLTYFDEFLNLAPKLQAQIFQACWSIWWRLEKLAKTTMEIRKNHRKEEIRKLERNTLLYSFDSKHIDVSWLSKYSLEELKFFLHLPTECYLDDLTIQMLDLEPSDIELSFMLGQLCFHYVGKRFQGEILQVADKFQNMLANDLHEYYTNEMKTPYYMKRLAQMMKINNQIQIEAYRNRSKIELAFVFDIFNVEFSHPEIFRDY